MSLALRMLAFLLLWVACTPEPTGSKARDDEALILTRAQAEFSLRAPQASDASDTCSDIGTTRVCWGGSCGGVPCVLPREVPKIAGDPPLRCFGNGHSRRCAPRFHGVGRFACGSTECIQKHPRLPDQNEWTCADQDGAVLCKEDAKAAIPKAGFVDPAFRCGVRRKTNERLCIDFDADFPDLSEVPGVAQPSLSTELPGLEFECRFEPLPKQARVCTPRRKATTLGARCGPEKPPCAVSASCIRGRCVPRNPVPDCWLDEDCGGGLVCRYGSCSSSAEEPSSSSQQREFAAQNIGSRGRDSSEQKPPDLELTWVIVRSGTVAGIERLEVRPKGAVKRYFAFDGAWYLGFGSPLSRERSGRSRAHLSGPGLCEASIQLEGPRARPTQVQMEPLVRIHGKTKELGFGASFALQVVPNCSLPKGARVRWKQVSGVDLGLEVSRLGFGVSGKTPAFDVQVGPAGFGVVPISARASGRAVLEARLEDAKGSSLLHERLILTAAARASGLNDVAVDHAVYLKGTGLTLKALPAGSLAGLEPLNGRNLFRLLPDVPGKFQVTDRAGRTMHLRAARLDSVPLDCGRSGCHTEQVQRAVHNPMAFAMARLDPEERSCAMGCHSVGELGARDGGFASVMSEINFSDHDLMAHPELPRALARMSHVGCVGCHGPSALPEPEARWAIVRSDVCAVCHDAPPRYAQVEAWRTSRMGQPKVMNRSLGPGCHRCHTTSGFLDDYAGTQGNREMPPDHEDFSLGCVTCHEIHAEQPSAHLLRVNSALAQEGQNKASSQGGQGRGSPSEVCVACHTARPDEEYPLASAASIFYGRGGYEPLTGGELVSEGAHAAFDSGCLGCHRGESTDRRRSVSHDFTASRTQCASCHDTLPEGADAWRIRALSVFQALSLVGRKENTTIGQNKKPAFIPHAEWQGERTKLSVSARGQAGARARALYNLALVLEDKAFDAHNLAYAKKLVLSAENLLNPEPPSPQREQP